MEKEIFIPDGNWKRVTKNTVYYIPESKNLFIALKDAPMPNDKAFMRVHDKQIHYAREFAEFKNGKMYYEIFEVQEEENENN